MRLNKQQINYCAIEVVKKLMQESLLITENKESVQEKIAHVISEELNREDELDNKVKEILNERLGEIRTANIDYFEMFKMIKNKLAKEENIIL